MRYDVWCRNCGGVSEIEKPMKAHWPKCRTCGSRLQRLYLPQTIPAVYFSGGIESFEKQVGPERAAKFAKEKDDIERRAKAGKLTDYERRLDALSRTQ